VQDVEESLHVDHVVAVDRHRQLDDALRLPSWSVGYGFDYVADGELDEEVEPGRLIHVGG
jgi:hypothetical protein